MSKNMKILFTCSVLLNVLLLGLAGGIAFFDHHRDPVAKMQEGMSPEGRNIVARQMQSAFRDGRSEMERARNLKAEIANSEIAAVLKNDLQNI